MVFSSVSGLWKKINGCESEALKKKMDRKEVFSLYKRVKKIVVFDGFKSAM